LRRFIGVLPGLLCLIGVCVSLTAQTRQPWGKTADGESIFLYTLRNAHRMEARITNFGAILVSLKKPDRAGRLADVVLGFDTFEE
jgi:aldose 1-epimerase